jgi:O-antigen biosynthesis protein
MPKKICIVSPDFVGPMKNGGIGTACYWLSRFLAQNNYQVTALYTGPFASGTYAEARQRYAEHHVDFQALSEIKSRKYEYFGMEGHGQLSERVYEYLKQQNFDVIHFQDWQGNGFSSIQAKTVGVAFAKTRLVVGVHSPLLWEREGMRIWSPDPVGDCRRDYMEKYAIEHADAVWAPSQAMLGWLRAHKINPAGQPRVIPYLVQLDESEDKPVSYEVRDPSHLVFFGRQETRKGVEIFAAAVNKLVNSGQRHGIKRITFLGKVGSVQNGKNAVQYLTPVAAKWNDAGIDWKVIDTYDAFQALRYIQKTGAVAVMPSLLDNYPYTVLECIRNGVPCLASAVGGIPEMLPAEVLFEPNANSLAEAMADRVNRIKHMRGMYSPGDVKRQWLEFSAELAAPMESTAPAPATPRVSICVAYYNYGAYLPHLMRSLKENDYPNFEVVVVNDGSTDPESVRVFEALKEELSPRGWKFLTQANQGIGATRNFAAKNADGEFLVFMDADNVAASRMISLFVQGMITSGADALTCIGTVFKGDVYPDEQTPVFYLYRPLGPVMEMAMMENVFGDANAIIRRSAFEAVGGYKVDRSTSYEDWELFALLALQDFKLDVVPEQLFYYRHLAEGFSRTTSLVQNQRRVLRAFLQHPEKVDLERLYASLLIPLFYAKQQIVIPLVINKQAAGTEPLPVTPSAP